MEGGSRDNLNNTKKFNFLIVISKGGGTTQDSASATPKVTMLSEEPIEPIDDKPDEPPENLPFLKTLSLKSLRRFMNWKNRAVRAWINSGLRCSSSPTL
jgi:hypothetical protein